MGVTMEVPPINPRAPLNQLREQRLGKNRDLKVIITSRNSTTGTGKTTLAVWLALNWDQEWTAAEKGTLSVSEYLDTYQDLSPGSVLVMDEAEQLDARRSMSQDNVDFAEKWMMMRVRNVTSILTLPTASALDKRLKELADVRINVHRRGRARVYKISVDDHDTSQVREWRWHDLEWPDISDHPEMQALDEQKQAKIDGELEAGDDDTQIDPKELRRQQKIEMAQRCRDNGDTLSEIADRVGMSEGWVSNNTEKPTEAKP
jgi:hypothetical protein